MISNDLNKIEQKVYRNSQQDGLLDLFSGLSMLAIAGAVGKIFMPLFFIVPLLLLGPVMRRIKTRVTYPRIGFSQPVPEKPGKLLGGIFAFIFVLFALTAVILTSTGSIGDFDVWQKWLPTFIGTLLVGMYFSLAGKSGQVRYYILAAASFVSGFAISIYHGNPDMAGLMIYFVSMGLISAVTGTITFLLFLKKFPVQQSGEVD
jgi:hypothetical protein